MAEDVNEYAAVQERIRKRAAEGFPIGIIPRGGRRQEPLPVEKRGLVKRLRPAIRHRIRKGAIERRLLEMNAIMEELKRYRRAASNKAKILEEGPVAQAMRAQVGWLAKYNDGILSRERVLTKHRRELASKKEAKKPQWMIKRVEDKIDRVERMSTPYNYAHQEFMNLRDSFANCVCPPNDMPLDSWLRAYAEELGLTCVAREKPRRRGHRGAATLAEREAISRERKPAFKRFTQTPADSPWARQREIDFLRMQINDLIRQMERLERQQRLGPEAL